MCSHFPVPKTFAQVCLAIYVSVTGGLRETISALLARKPCGDIGSECSIGGDSTAYQRTQDTKDSYVPFTAWPDRESKPAWVPGIFGDAWPTYCTNFS